MKRCNPLGSQDPENLKTAAENPPSRCTHTQASATRQKLAWSWLRQTRLEGLSSIHWHRCTRCVCLPTLHAQPKVETQQLPSRRQAQAPGSLVYFYARKLPVPVGASSCPYAAALTTSLTPPACALWQATQRLPRSYAWQPLLPEEGATPLTMRPGGLIDLRHAQAQHPAICDKRSSRRQPHARSSPVRIKRRKACLVVRQPRKNVKDRGAAAS